MAYINFRNKKLYSSRLDRPGWFDNTHGWTRENGLDEFYSFKNSYTPQSNTKILLRNQYFISTRYHSGYGDSVSYDTFGRSNISSNCIDYTFNDTVYYYSGSYVNISQEIVGKYGFFSPFSQYVEGNLNTNYRITGNLRSYGFDNGSNKAYRTKFYFKKVDYDRF